MVVSGNSLPNIHARKFQNFNNVDVLITLCPIVINQQKPINFLQWSKSQMNSKRELPAAPGLAQSVTKTSRAGKIEYRKFKNSPNEKVQINSSLILCIHSLPRFLFYPLKVWVF